MAWLNKLWNDRYTENNANIKNIALTAKTSKVDG